MGNDRNDTGSRGHIPQGTGGLGGDRASSTPAPGGSQPHLGNAAHRAPGGTGETEGASQASTRATAGHEELDAVDRARGSAAAHRDRLDAIELADDRTEALNPHRGARANDASGDLGDALAGPASDAAYVDEAHRETPTLGAIDDDKDNM